METLPVIGGAAGVTAIVVALVALGRFLLSDKREITDLRLDIRELRDHVMKLEALYDEQRTEKHRILNELTKASMLLGIIVDLADKCTCGALALVDDLMRRVSTGSFVDEP